MWVFFLSVPAELCLPLSFCWGWGGLLLSLFWCGCCAFLLGHMRFSPECPAVAALLGFCTWLTQVGYPTPVVDVFVGLVGSWYSTWFSTLCRRGFPLAGSAPSPFCCLPFTGAAPFQAPVCGSPSAVGPCGWVRGYLLRHLVFSLVPCSSSEPAACAAFPAAGYLGVFRSPGVRPSASLVTLVGLQPFPSFLCFSCSACLQGLAGLCTLCQGAPVAVVSAWVEGAVTLLPFPYLRVGVLLAYGVSGVCGLRRRSRLPFVVRHPFPVSVGPSPFLGLGWLVTALWPLL